MTRYWSVIFSLCWFAVSSQSLDSLVVTDSDDSEVVKEKKQTLGFRLYWDFGKTAFLWTDFEEKHEGGIELLLVERIQLIGEAGLATLHPSDAFQNGDYTSEGYYTRVGIGYLTNVDQRNKIGLGVRYGVASFDDRLEIKINSNSGLNDPFDQQFQRNSLSARWVEFVLNSEKFMTLNRKKPESPVNELLSLGFLFRCRVMVDYDKQTPIDVYSIPGYGRTLSGVVPALNLFLKINLF